MNPPPERRQPAKQQTVGVIGCGNYAYTTIAWYLRRAQPGVIGACMDRNLARAASLAQAYGVPLYTNDAAEIFDQPDIRLIYISSNHASHAEYAIAGLERGKDVYIEKPHVVSEDQLARLTAAMRNSRGRVYLGFNRPGSRLGCILREHLGREAGPGVYNWFVAGHAIDPDHWYFRREEGGRVLGNLCHWTDFLLSIAPQPQFPIRITPARHDKSDSDLAVSYTFGDGTIGVITFSAKGHTFEGVREQFRGHRGDALVALDDFQKLTVEIGPKKRTYRNLFRDHGHGRNILFAFENSTRRLAWDGGDRLRHAADTAWLFLKTREALETQRQLVIDPYPLDPPASLRAA